MTSDEQCDILLVEYIALFLCVIGVMEMKKYTGRIKAKGFTLIEIIVVISIIGVLMAILVPSLIGYVKRAKKTSDMATAKEIWYNVNQIITEDKGIAWTTPSAPNKVFYSGALESFYSTNGSSYKQIMSGSYKPQWYTKVDEEGNIYHLIPVVTYGPRTNRQWMKIDQEQEAIAYFLNNEASGISDKGLKIKYQPKGQDPDLNTWFVCYRSNDVSQIEVWVGCWKSSDPDFGGSGAPVYRVYPDPTY